MQTKGLTSILVMTMAIGLTSACSSTSSSSKNSDGISPLVSENSIPIIDTHIHLYDTEREEGLPWPPESDTVLYRPVLTEDFDAIARANNLTATVIVEASDWEQDNQWVLDLVKHDPLKYVGLVGSLEIGSNDFQKNLEKYARDARYVGIRMRPRPNGDDFFNDAVWRDLTFLADKGMTLDVLMFDFSIKDVNMVAQKLPNLKILMNHVAGADIDGNPVDPEWLADLQLAAQNPNVFCKVSGLFQQSHQQPSPKNTSFYQPVLDALWNTFGEDRLIYGSNWPVTDRGGSYSDYLHIVLDYFTPKGDTALRKLLYQNAATFYGLSGF